MPPSATLAGIRRAGRLLGIIVAAIQRDLSSALGLSPESRTGTVVAMLASNARRAPGYWIQLTLAMGIATLGLVLGSTAVVIGAMLVSPLMGPIIELGMGFAVGSSLLVIRSFFRVTLSVLWVIASAALVTLMLPFHEVTSEIAARTAPTALDLLVAVFCALTAAYTTARAASDTTAAAAGTAIGIALVPPLCVIGYGVGTFSSSIASGAALLFIANFSAIVVLAAVSFVLLGYNDVDAEPIEHEYLEHAETRTGRLAEWAHEKLRRLFGSRHGRKMRFVIPALFLLAVYVPLNQALDEVAWQVRVRNAVDRMLAADRSRIVQTSLAVERHAVTLRLFVLGAAGEALALERRLERQIAAAAGVEPAVSVVAVPDAAAMAALSAAERGAPAPVVARLDLNRVRERVAAVLAAEWPTGVAGPLAGWSLEVPDGGSPVLRVHHVGAPLGAGGEAMLSRRVSDEVGMLVAMRGEPLPAATVAAARGEERAWVGPMREISRAVAAAPRAVACVTTPLRDTARAPRAARPIVEAVATSPAAQARRLVLDTGSTWAIRVAVGQCAPAAPAAPAAAPAPPSASAASAPGTPAAR